MPIYEYQCIKCGKKVEVLQKIDDKPPECHGPMKKLMSVNNFHLKGTGWYATDYKNKKEKTK